MDVVFQRFLENTASDAVDLQRTSDVVTLQALPPQPASRYVCEFRVPYLRRLPAGTVVLDPGPVACSIRFPCDYLRSGDTRLYIRVAAVLSPDFIHPNVLHGVVCLGAAFAPGTPLRGLLWQLWEVITYQNCTVDERNAMNGEACRLVRAYPHLIASLERPRLFRPRQRLGAER